MTRARAVTLGSTLLAVLAGALALGAAASRPADAPQPGMTGRLMVTVKAPPPALAAESPGATRRRVSERIEQVLVQVEGAGAKESVPELGLVTLRPERGTDPAELAARLERLPQVVDVRPEPTVRLHYLPDDPAFNRTDPNAPGADLMQWHLRRERFPGAWRFSKGAAARVAILDTGMDAGHPELAERRIAAVDHGGAQPDTDEHGHGTHVAGLACASADNALAIASPGFRCRLIVEKLAGVPGGGLTLSSLIAAVVDAANRDADAINMSLGGPTPHPELRGAIAYAWERGSIPVASAANSPSPGPHYPAQYVQPAGSGPNLAAGKGLVVTSANHGGERSAFAEKSAGVSVAAFGSATDATSGGQQGIVSTWPGGPISGDLDYPGSRTSIDGDDRYAYLVGTSMAAPQVAGLVALIRSVRPGIGPARLVRVVKLTADGYGDYGRGLGWGIIDAYAALAGALRRDIVPPASRVRSARALGAAVAAGAPGRQRVRLRLRRRDRARPGLRRSGIRRVTVFVSRGGGRFRRLARTKRRRLTVRLRGGHRYRFYSRALDRAGNREAAPSRVDVAIGL